MKDLLTDKVAFCQQYPDFAAAKICILPVNIYNDNIFVSSYSEGAVYAKI